jgi:Ca2+-binding RTX toxin-like protein
LHGGTGNDQLDGGNGNDVLIGAFGEDNLVGGAGNDRLNGDTSTYDPTTNNPIVDGADDVLTGGAGDDVFVFQLGAGDDTITDFTHESDRIDIASELLTIDTDANMLAELLGNIAVVSGDSVITFSSGDTLTVVGVTDLVDLDLGIVFDSLQAPIA